MQTHVVIGGSSGIGRDVAERLASSGNKVIVLSREDRGVGGIDLCLSGPLPKYRLLAGQKCSFKFRIDPTQGSL